MRSQNSKQLLTISILLSIFCSLVGCAAKTDLPPVFRVHWDLDSIGIVPPIDFGISDTAYASKMDSLNHFTTSLFFPSDLSDIKNISGEKKNFKLKNGLFFSSSRGEIGFRFFLITSSRSFIVAQIKNNRLYWSSEFNNGTIDWKQTYYDELGNLKRIEIASLQNDLDFDQGTGYYKDLYNTTFVDTVRYKQLSDIECIGKYDDAGLRQKISFRILNDSLAIRVQYQCTIKEEGNIKNNYKIGIWKYYDKTGKFITSKEYKINDKVDVRFPYCLYNKKEPCFCGE